MKVILGTNQYSGAPLEIVKALVPKGFVYQALEAQTEECFIRAVPDADYILAGGRTKVTARVLESAKRLRMIQRSGVGLDALDLDAIRERGIPLYVNQGVNAESVAEHTLLLMLACLRRLPTICQNTKNGLWNKQAQGVQTAELKGKTVGIVGMGNIAKTLVGLLQPFHVRILYNNIFQEPVAYEAENGLRFVGMEELLRDSDIVTIHCALTPETENLINADTIRMMKPGAILVNTARGGIVEPLALAEGLRSGRLSYAALDVHAREPLPEDYPLKSVDNVILTPHVAGVTADSFRAMMYAAFRNIECFDRGDIAAIAPYRYL